MRSAYVAAMIAAAVSPWARMKRSPARRGADDVQVRAAARYAEHQPRSCLGQRPYDRIGARVGRDGAGAGSAGFQ